MLYLFGKKLGTQHYPTVAGVGYTTPTYEIMDVGCWVHNNQLYKSWLLGTQQPTNFRRCVVLCWFLLVQPMSEFRTKMPCQNLELEFHARYFRLKFWHGISAQKSEIVHQIF